MAPASPIRTTSRAFVAAGLSSDHEVWALDEAWDRLSRGIFVELRPFSYDVIMPRPDRARPRGLVEHRLHHRRPQRVGNAARLGASDHNVRHAIDYGLEPEIAIQCATINPARHMRIDQWVGSITPGRYADIVLLDDVRDALDRATSMPTASWSRRARRFTRSRCPQSTGRTGRRRR